MSDKSAPDFAHIVIVGGGAAGLATAIFASEACAHLAEARANSVDASDAPSPSDSSTNRSTRILLLDGAKSLGAKILVAGGGRCNVTHHKVHQSDYNGSQHVVRNVLAAFTEADTVRWFDSLGVALKQEPTGKLFPVADSARVVLNALLRRCEELNVEIRTNTRVISITHDSTPPRLNDSQSQRLTDPTTHDSQPTTHDPHPAPFTLHTAAGPLRAARVVLSTGGKSLPRSGSDGAGWEIVRSLGHTVTDTHAALAPLVLDPSFFHVDLAGIALDVELTVTLNNKRIDRRTGSLLWTHFGISGPVVMDASRHWIIPRETGHAPRLACNLLPGMTPDQADAWLLQSATARPKAALLTILTSRLPERVATAIVRHVQVESDLDASIDPATPLAQLPRESRKALVRALTDLTLPVTQHRGWNYAEVTAGGVPLPEIDFRTMQSRLVKGLFLAGEILDVDGRIGGFNFQWAWSTGHAAGNGLIQSLMD